VEEYRNVVSPYLSLKKAISLCHHPIDVGTEKAMSTEQVELAQSHHAMVHAKLVALQERHENVV